MDSVLKSVLMEEYHRKIKNRTIYINKLDNFPRGSLVKKKRKNHYSYYLAYRDGDKVITDYVKKEDLNSIKNAINMRNQIAGECKNLSKQIRDLEKILKINKNRRKLND